MKERFLLVQCCHLPHFLYVAGRMLEKYPGCRLDALVLDHPQVHSCRERFPAFDRVFLFKQGAALDLPEVPAIVVFPLLNRGYRKLKLAARSLGGQLWESNFEADLQPLTASRLLLSQVKALHSPTEGFQGFLADFPRGLLGQKVLLVESGGPQIVERNHSSWKTLAAGVQEVTGIPGNARPWPVWKQLREKSFDSAVVFFTGERGYLGLKLLPFLLRVPQVLVVNENGDHYFANGRGMLGFFLKRLRYGRNLPAFSQQTVLVIQTEGAEQIGKAIEAMKDPKVTRGGHLAVFCSEIDREHFEGLPDVQKVFAYKPRDFRGSLSILLRVLSVRPDVVAAVFSKRPIFRLQKLFFLMVPARHHLVFNENLDCYYLRPGNLLNLFSRQEDLSSFRPLRMLLKFLLFVPRFLFLVIWVTVVKLKRAYTSIPGK
jgi:hypothetical protein